MIEVNKEKEIYYQISSESEITWQEQNEIHRFLNKAYAGISTSFLAKTYAKSPPQQRILLFMKNELIGHLGLFERSLVLGEKKVPFLGMGLFAVDKESPGFGMALVMWGIEQARKYGTSFAVGRTHNPTVVKISEMLGAKTYKAKLISDENDATKDDDVILFYPLNKDEDINGIINAAKVNNEFMITGGSVF